MKNLILIFGFIAVTFLMSCKPKVNPNEWVVVTTTCWNQMKVVKAGQMVPRMMTTCDRMVTLPATELAAEFVTETKFQGRLAGEVELTYQWKIVDPVEFIGSAKSITSSGTKDASESKIDPDKLEAIENAVVDKLLINLVREYTPTVDPGNINELTIEKEIEALSKNSFKGRGIEFSNLSVNVTLSPQAEEALDIISALDFYRKNNEEELGREVIKAKAGATNIKFSK